jgi:MFS transporter, DHA1 family, tetracycline resistance protein
MVMSSVARPFTLYPLPFTLNVYFLASLYLFSNMELKNRKISILPLLAINFIGTLGFSIMLPFLVYLVREFKGNEFLYGALGAFYSLFQLVGAPVLGRLSDSYGRKKILFICEAGSFFSWIIFFIALLLPVHTLFSVSSAWIGTMVFTLPMLVLFIARAVDGITAGDISVANAYLSDITDPQDLKKNFGRISASANLGFIFGPLLAAGLGGTILGLKLPIIVAGAISFVSMFLIIFMLPESFRKNSDKDSHSDQSIALDSGDTYRPSFISLLKLPHVGFMVSLYFLIFLGFNFFYTAFPLYAAELLKWNVTQMGIFFAVLSGIMVLVQGPVLSAISRRVSDETLTIIGGFILATNFLLMMSHNTVIIYIGAFLFSLGNGLMWPSFLSILSRVAGHKYQGAIQGIASGAGSLASIIGLLGGGILYHLYFEKTFLITAVIIYLVSIISFRLLKMKIAPKKVSGQEIQR